MKPIEFKDPNVIYAKNQSEYMTLPALKLSDKEGSVISCWKMSFRDRLKILLTGKVWLNLASFNKALTPSYMSVNRKNVYSHPSDSESIWKKLKELINNKNK